MPEWRGGGGHLIFINLKKGILSVSQKRSGFQRFVGLSYSATLDIFHMPKFQSCIYNLKVTKKGAFTPPVLLVFHLFQPNLAYILRFAQKYPDFMVTFNINGAVA